MTQIRTIRVRGQVQGVGFRPFVWQLARAHGLRGWVLNDAQGVLIGAAGADLDAFAAALSRDAPPLARVDAVEQTDGADGIGPDFQIVASGAAGSDTRVTPDAATCPACLAEINGDGRRKGYAFTNCTHCGPRLTILEGLPYDRARTTMAPFPMCPACLAEYADPADRRFHAQPIACPACGPKLWLETAQGRTDAAPIAAAAALLRQGGLLAVKGLGGVHLACLATDATAIATLRARKHRPAKPLALMGTPAMVARHAAPSEAAWQRLSDPAAPIVLLARTGTDLPDLLAPGIADLGWMLPYTPLHHLLLAEIGAPLVMTSANVSGEPQVIGNDEAREKLAGIADGFLLHDRAIARRLDDSVERETPFGPMILRRARGRVPGTLPLPPGFEDTPQILAQGGQMKAALCLVKNGQALLGHHLGELDEALTWQAYQQAEADYCALFDLTPQVRACDAHPGYRATRHAEASGDPVISVQHHHAHLAACMGENGWARTAGPVVGIVLDGLGLGPDGTIWGGEVLLGDYTQATRIAHLDPAPLAGGDGASVEPWRNALVRLDQAGLGSFADKIFADHPVALIRQAVASGVNAPLSSSAGRLFDAVAALLGLCPARQSYEGEAAMRLESLARQAGPAPGYPFGQQGSRIDPSPMIRAVVGDLGTGRPPAEIAAAFQTGLAQAFARAARAAVEGGQATAVALTGGCFQNPALVAACLRELDGLPVLLHRQVPANDGGLSFGQALVAAAKLQQADAGLPLRLLETR